MNAKEFLKNRKIFHGLGVEEDNTSGNTHKIADLLEEYHQSKLKSLGITDVSGGLPCGDEIWIKANETSRDSFEHWFDATFYDR